MSKVIHVTDSEFEHIVLESSIPVLVDYWAEWCGPCKVLAPLLDKVAEEYEGKLIVCKLDISSNQQIASTYGIRNIPTLMLFKQGEAIATKVGSLSKAQLNAFIDASID